jgi:ornithine cyclodeaminase
VCIVDAGEITAIRTAAASAVATDVLACPQAHKLALVGCGDQAATHARAIGKVRAVDTINVWGRSPERAHRLALDLQHELGTSVTVASDVRSAIADADIICTVSGAKEPILKGGWVKPGTHLNIVGSSHAGAAEVDNELVARSRFIVDSREGVLAQGGEFLRAKSAGVVDESHIVAEIGQVLSGEVEGRQYADQITAYKSLGHIVQDLATAWSLY